MDAESIGIIILAAGASTRLGRPKQLLEFGGKTLLERISETAVETELKTVIVLGSDYEKIRASIKHLPVEIVFNKDWEAGMASSIGAGLKKISELEPGLAAAIILLCDQPFINKESIMRLVQTQKETGKSIVASEYGGSLGVPAMFTRNMFGELVVLRGDKGAKSLIEKYKESDLAKVPAPEAEVDIDSEEDFAKLKAFLEEETENSLG